MYVCVCLYENLFRQNQAIKLSCFGKLFGKSVKQFHFALCHDFISIMHRLVQLFSTNLCERNADNCISNEKCQSAPQMNSFVVALSFWNIQMSETQFDHSVFSWIFFDLFDTSPLDETLSCYCCGGWTSKVLEHNPSDKCVCNFSMLIFISVVYFILRCAQRSVDNAWPFSTRCNHVRVCNYACVRILCRIAFDFECLLFWSRRQPHCGECFRKHNDLKLFSVRGANELVVRNYFGIVSL